MAKKQKRSQSRTRSISARKSVSKSKPVKYLKSFSSWVTSAKSKGSLLSQQQYFRDGIKLVRKLYAGFTPERGFDVRLLKHWPHSRIEELRGYISDANRLTSGEYHELYTLARPRTSDQIHALQLHTSQVSRDERRHPQQRWVIYANTRKARVRYVVERVPIAAAMGRGIFEERVRAEVVQPVKGGRLVHRDYLFREVLGFQPGIESTTPGGMRMARFLGTVHPWEQMIAAMRVLVRIIPDRTRAGEEAYYRLLTDRGPVYSAVPKHFLVQLMQQWGEEYERATDFAGMLIGVRFTGDEFKARREGRLRDERRRKYERSAYERRLARARLSRKKSRKKSRSRKKKSKPLKSLKPPKFPKRLKKSQKPRRAK